VCINEFLIREGYLRLKSEPSAPTRLRPDMVDWDRTTAWGDGGYYARVFLNVAGRESHGTIAAGDVERVRAELRAKLEALGDEEGNSIGTRVFYPHEVYRECRGIPPDMIVYLGDLDWRSAGTVGNGRVHVFDNDTGPDDANHAEYGIFIYWDPRRDLGGRALSGLEIRDFAPTVLRYFGLPVPADMQGRVIPL
jgi:predicted AlkP superfamily phosphohydrolase/phosphomutase